MIIDSAGYIYILGRWRTNDSEGLQHSYLLETNSNGDSIWYREYTHFTSNSSDNELLDIKQTDDGGFIMAGKTNAPFTPFQSQHIWVLKVDSFGCDTPGCQHVGIHDVPQSQAEFNVYPNPTTDYVIADYRLMEADKKAEIRILDNSGRLIKAIALNKTSGQEVIDCRSLTGGLYIFSLYANGRNTISRKVSVHK